MLQVRKAGGLGYYDPYHSQPAMKRRFVTSIGEMKNRQPQSPDLSLIPDEIKFEITASCNLRCSFCYNKNTFAHHLPGSGLSLEQAKTIVDRIAEAGIPRIRFTGGEPLLYPFLRQLIEHARNRNLFVKLNTNGTRLSEDMASFIKAHVQVVLMPVYSTNAEGDFKITGSKESFGKRERGTDMLACSSVDLWACTVATSWAIPRIREIRRFVSDRPFDYWFVLREMPTPERPHPVTLGEMQQLIETMVEIHEEEGSGCDIGSAVPLCCYDPQATAKVVEGVKNHEGRSQLVVDPEGRARVDYCIDETLGELSSTPIRSIWQDERVRNFREDGYLPSRCGSCRFKATCRGGSRFAAKVVSGDWLAMDPLAAPDRFLNEELNASPAH